MQSGDGGVEQTSSKAMTTINDLLSSLLTEENNNTFYSFSNVDGKQWIMPAKRMKTGMNLYQPSGVKGKLLKKSFPYLHRIGLIRNRLHAEVIHCRLRDDIYRLLCRSFEVDGLEFSIFGGTPSVHQKITIQLSIGNQILGYCKVSDSDEILSLFEHESYILETLHSKGIIGIPRCLFRGTLYDGIGVFIQTTVKTNRSHVVHEWTQLQNRFLINLHEKTKQNLLFENTDYYQTLIALKGHIDWLPEGVDSHIVMTAIENVFSEYKGKEVEFSAYHADFTPWNMFVEHNRLFVFDFEYARMTYPPMLDRYHFFLQTAIFERHWTVEEIIIFIKSKEGKWVDNGMFILYLLGVMAQFTIREQGNVTGDVINSFSIWLNLLKYLLQ